MFSHKLFMLVVSTAFACTVASADQLMVYPKEGQSSQQQSQDKAECYSWAQQQLGYDPQTLLNQSQQAGTAGQSQQGSAVRGAGRGAAAGAIGGAIGGDAGKGAAIGAGVGGAAGARRRNQAEREQEQAHQQANAQIQQKMNNFNKAQATCLNGKGYSVG
ncbi:MAG: glycine zipper family protein [Bdellovibrionia bacterium]